MTRATIDARPDWLPYVLPMLLFVGLTSVEGLAAVRPYFVGAYALKLAVVTIALAASARAWRSELRPDARAIGLGVVVGLLAFGLWIGLEKVTPALPFLAARGAFDPFAEIGDPGLRLAFLVARFAGLALIVPVMEEAFWRSFGLRFATDQDRWKRLPLGDFSPVALGLVAVAFAAIHARTEWLAALVFAALMAFLLRRTRSLSACMVAHGVTNGALGAYVLSTGSWHLW
jgi:CAAX prenyl protease-like protein